MKFWEELVLEIASFDSTADIFILLSQHYCVICHGGIRGITKPIKIGGTRLGIKSMES